MWGNGLISVDADTGVTAVTLPGPLRHLANAARGRFVLSHPVEFNHRGTQWAAQTATAALSYALWFDPGRSRWYLDASWQTATAELPSLHQLRGLHTLAVDLNADHLAAWVITGDGNPIGDPVTIAYDSSGGAGSQQRQPAPRHHATVADRRRSQLRSGPGWWRCRCAAG